MSLTVNKEALAWKADEAAENLSTSGFAVELAPSKPFAFGNDVWSYGVATPPNAALGNDAWLYGNATPPSVASPNASLALLVTLSRFIAP